MEKDELLDKYFEGSLSKAEHIVFEKLLVEDIEYKEQWEFEKDVRVAVKSTNKDLLKSKLQGFEHDIQQQKSIKRSFWKPLSIAASLLMFIAASWYLYDVNINNNPEKLYASNYEKYPNTVYTITRGAGAEDSLEQKAFGFYEINDNVNAILYFKELKEKSGLDYIDFYLAQSYLNNGDTQKAIVLFEKIISEKSDFYNEARWYLALASVKAGNKIKAIKFLEKLIENASYKKIEAEELLEKLK